MNGSWLVLERYVAGDLADDERAAVELLLREDPDARAVVEAIRGDVRPLEPLQVPRRWPVFAVAVAAAVGVVVIGLRPTPTVKGGEFAVQVVRDRDGVLDPHPGSVVAGDRFVVRLTCPPGSRPFDLVVFQDGEAFFPIDRGEPVVCGNAVPLPGGFRVDSGSPLTVCVVVDALPDRARLAAGPDAAGACTSVP